MSQEAVGQLDEPLFHARRAVELDERDARVQQEIRRGLGPAPHALGGDGRAAEVARTDVAVAGGIHAGDPLRRRGRVHRPLDLLRPAVVEHHRLAEHVDALFVAVQFVGLDGRQAVGEQPLRVEGFHFPRQRRFQPRRIHAHERGRRPVVREVAVVGQAAAELAVLDLAVVDVPVHEPLDVPEQLDLPEGPERHAGGRGGQRHRRPRLLAVVVVPGPGGPGRGPGRRGAGRTGRSRTGCRCSAGACGATLPPCGRRRLEPA